MDLESLIEQTKNEMGGVIQKPKMADKLLSRPPFRFLHDTIAAVIQATGFADGLYSPEELDSGTLGDKNAKMEFLAKIIALVGICQVRMHAQLPMLFL
jgi:TRAF3-interacting protein 1